MTTEILMMLRVTCLLCCLFTTFLSAADLPDPTTSWQPRHAIATLAALRAPLDARPNDPSLLAAAQMAYVELCFMGDPDLSGALGPWLERAREMSRLRRLVHGEAAWKTLAEAAPDLWLAVIEGRNQEVLDALKTWPEAIASTEGRALRAIAAVDTTIFEQQPPQTALELYAYLVACSATRVNPVFLTNGQVSTNTDPLAILLAQSYINGWADTSYAVRSVITDVAWMCNSSEIPDLIANEALDSLSLACGVSDLPRGTRSERMQKVMQAARRCDTTQAQPIIAAWKACRAVSGPGSLLSAAGQHRLVGVPEVATWNLDRLYLVAFHQMKQLNDANRAHLSEIYRKELPGSMIACRASFPANSRQASRSQADDLAAAAYRCLSGEEGSSPAIAAWASERIADIQLADAAPLITRIFERLHPKAGPNSSITLHVLFKASQLASCTGVIAEKIISASAANPYNQDLYLASRYINSRRPLVHIGDLKPSLERIDPAVHVPNMPIPGTTLSEFVSGRWNGFMLLDAGTTRVAIESDDGARLFLGDTLVLNLGQHGMQIRSTTVTTTATDWLPLSMEWYNYGGGGGIRLLWQPHGATAWEPVPADRLSHSADHQPGLTAQFWQLDRSMKILTNGPHSADMQRVNEMLWHYRAVGELGRELAMANREREGLPLLRLACAKSSPNEQVRWVLFMVLIDLATPELADELAEAFHYQSCLHDDLRNAVRLGNRMALAGSELKISKLFGPKPRGCCVEGLPLGFMAICRAEWQQALDHFTDLESKHNLNQPNDRYLREQLLFLKAILQRAISKQEPDWNSLRDFSQDTTTTPYIRLFAKWYTGQITWEDARARRATTVDGDAILWLHALHSCTVGEHEQAKQDIMELTKAHQDWIESNLSNGLLRWYGRQTPESLAAQPTAPPLPAQRGTPSPEEKPNF